jgi:hypothetical protein
MELNEYLKASGTYENIVRPVCAFITFESDDGLNTALSLT